MSTSSKSQEEQLEDMTNFAIGQIDENDSQEFVKLRTTYDEILKIAAMHLSERTGKEQLVKLLRICSFIGNDKLTDRLLALVKPKMNSLDNQELSHLYQILVLLQKQDPSFTKSLELMTLRRIHALEADHVSQIIKSYSMLLEQGKLGSPVSVTFVQAFEQKIAGNHQVFHENLNSLIQAAVALLKLYRLSRLPGCPAPVVTKNALLETY